MRPFASFLRRFARNRTAFAGLFILVLVLVVALVAPIVYPDDPWDMVAAPFLWPGTDPSYPLGSDMLGRDIASGIFHGARVSLAIGFVATLVATLVGTFVGAVGGFYGGRVDAVLTAVTELFQTIPPFILAVVLVAILQPTITTIIMAIAMVSWPTVARLVRSEILSLRSREFVQACFATGMSDARIIVRHVLPNALPPVIVTSALMVATAILLEAGLSFLGLGDPNVMSWGSIISAGRDALRSAWYITAIPGIAILLTVLALNLVGEGLNDVLNPRSRERS